MSVAEIAARIPISRPAVSRHLKLLKEAGLVVDRAVGTRRLYSLHSEGVEAMTEFMASIWGDVTTRFKLAAENTQERDR